MAKKLEKIEQVEKESLKTAKAHKLPILDEENFQKLENFLKPFGVKMEVTPIRSGVYRQGKEPFALKIKTYSFTFLVSKD